MNYVRYLLITALTVSSLSSVAINTDKLEEAIELSSFSRVKVLLKKTEDENSTLLERKKMLTHLLELAEEVSQNRVNSLSLFADWRDGARTVAGGLLIGINVLCVVKGVRTTNPGLLVGGMVFGSLGVYLMYTGIRCSSQRVIVDQAKAVEKFLKGKLRAVETDGE